MHELAVMNNKQFPPAHINSYKEGNRNQLSLAITSGKVPDEELSCNYTLQLL